MTAEELYAVYQAKSGDTLPYDMLDPFSLWSWEEAAKYATAFGGVNPSDNIRSIKRIG